MRQISFSDKLIMLADNSIKTLFGGYQTTPRSKPLRQDNAPSEELTTEQAKHSAGLMRINHCGEVCAQALYQGQALTAKLPEVREKMAEAAAEENDHLAWCSERLVELDSRVSLLNPFWYAGSFTIGALAGIAGDKWSLGFVAETEHQVVRHLDEHLEKLPANDLESREILVQMRTDELQHATNAIEAGGADLPLPIKKMMGVMSKVMTSTVYYV